MIKRLLLSLLIIVGVSTSAFVAAKALLSDQATLAANTFSTGTPDLLICSGKTCSDYQDSHTGFSDAILPGETKTKFFRLKNNSSDVDFSIAAQAASISGAISANDVTITFVPVDSSYNPEASSSPTTRSLADWVGTPTSLGLPNINHGDIQRYKMDVTLSSSVTTGGVSSIFDFIFTGTQVGP